MKNGEFIYADTHADFLNQAFGTNYKAWIKSAWFYDKDTFVWMVRFDHINREGWRNVFETKERIKEENLYEKKIWDGIPMSKLVNYKRIVIEVKDDIPKKYIFRGIYKYDEENSDPYVVHYFDKIADEF